jgi:hypothetical protein
MNTLKKDDYFSQRNNELKPFGACNVTMMIMILSQAGYSKDVYIMRDFWNAEYKTNFKQPEDSLMNFLQQDKYREKSKGALKDWYKYPEQGFNALVDGTNDWMKENICFVSWSESLDMINDYIINGFGVGVCGDFPGTAGHFVDIGGLSDFGIMINDPYGNYLKEYQDKNGYDVEMPIGDFNKYVYGPKGKTRKYFAFIARPKE